jgi:hypothetical protein
VFVGMLNRAVRGQAQLEALWAARVQLLVAFLLASDAVRLARESKRRE